jgi:DNA-binding transcriptional regulator YbjK
VPGREDQGLSPRQVALLSAAVRVTAGQGLRGLTHRAVDAEAGLPQGTCSAYFRTRVALLVALTRFVIATFTEEITDLTARIEARADEGSDKGAVDGYAVTEAARMLRGWLREPDLLLVRMELSLEGSRQPEVARIVQEQSARLVDVVEAAMEHAQLEHGRHRAVTLVAALDGLLLRAVREDPATRDDLVREGTGLLMHALLGVSPTTHE